MRPSPLPSLISLAVLALACSVATAQDSPKAQPAAKAAQAGPAAKAQKPAAANKAAAKGTAAQGGDTTSLKPAVSRPGSDPGTSDCHHGKDSDA